MPACPDVFQARARPAAPHADRHRASRQCVAPIPPIIFRLTGRQRSRQPREHIFVEGPKWTKPAGFPAGFDGGAKRDRTADLYNAIVALSQLSYGPDNLAPVWAPARVGSLCSEPRPSDQVLFDDIVKTPVIRDPRRLF